MDVRFHLPVLSECDSECKLCSTLNCLRPARLTFPEFLEDIDRALLSCTSSVVFPPNFLNHSEAAQFCVEARRKGLRAIVRIRPSQLKTHKHLLSELEHRGATFEVCVLEPLTHVEAPVKFKTVLLPSRLYDPTLLYESLPFSWRRDLEVLADPSLISADQLSLFLNSQPVALKPYADRSRRLIGQIPGVRPLLRRFGPYSDQTSLSVILESVTIAQLEALSAQSCELNRFEIIGVYDADKDPNDDIVAWCASHSLSVTLVSRPERWSRLGRQSEAFSLGAEIARGSRFLFVEKEATLSRDFVAQMSRESRPLVKVEIRADEVPVRFALSVDAKTYFSEGGFALPHDGFFFDCADSISGGVVLRLGDQEKIKTPRRPKSERAERSLAARDFYFVTLDPKVYSRHFALLGARPRLRAALRSVALLSGIRLAITKFNDAVSRAQASRLQMQLRKTLS